MKGSEIIRDLEVVRWDDEAWNSAPFAALAERNKLLFELQDGAKSEQTAKPSPKRLQTQ